ncbi:hypothetical protein [Tenacibaculum xiamenense]|uniref:hypothetical protein n=1 Tax=Tenacibaculum xiamenense TaxID=1261553 RepID=UPI0038B5CDE9
MLILLTSLTSVSQNTSNIIGKGGVFEALDAQLSGTATDWKEWFKYGKALSLGKVVETTEVGEEVRRFNFYDLYKTSSTFPSGSFFNIKDANSKERMHFSAWDDSETRFAIFTKDKKEIFKTGNLLPSHKDNPTNEDIHFVHLIKPKSKLSIGTWVMYKPNHELTVRGSGWFEEDIITESKIGIGVDSSDIPTDFELAVKGDIICEELKVKLATKWPDYVFDKNYNLPSLEEVARHIKEKKHLKGVPSAEEVEKEGVYLGEINSVLLKKIEELTLYTLKQEKRLNSQEQVIKELKEMLIDIKNNE